MSDDRARRAIGLFLLTLTLLVPLRTAAGAPMDAAGARIEGARVALFDPEGRAQGPLQSLGAEVNEVRDGASLTLERCDLIVVGPGGFARGRESIGPSLAARARAGTPVLLLAQPTIPATLADDLRLWPLFRRGDRPEVLIAARHPIFLGLQDGAAYLASATATLRPFLPPPRDNYRALAVVRTGDGPASQEGVAILELPVGDGTLLAAQASLLDDFDRDPRARRLLANVVAYLIGGPARPARAFLYGTEESLPPCLRLFRPRLDPAPADLRDVGLLLVPGDWQAPLTRSHASLPPPALVSRYLREGGTVVLLNPQSLVLEENARTIGAAIYFSEAVPAGLAPAAASPLLQGIAPDDLTLLDAGAGPEFRLRPRPGPGGIEPVLLLPGLSHYRVGRGSLVALTLPDASRCESARLSGLVARLLTNLGVPLGPATGAGAPAVTRLGVPRD